ncbi:MAG: XRE family transcriptional regulator [Alistipes sp.]|nr:XRE family transcriptional regulator [Alistipes sp.]
MVDRISDLAKKKGISIAALEKAIGISNGIIGKWKKQSPSCDKLKLVADYLNTTLDYLVYGEEKKSLTLKLDADEQELLGYFKKLSDKSKGIVLGKAETLAELEDSKPELTHSEHEEKEEPETIFIEFATLKASAGTGEQLIDDPEQDFIEVVKNDTTLQAKFAIQIHGDSMNPEYSNGDIVLVKTQPQINVGQIGIFTVNDMGYIKKLGTDRLVSINPEHDDIYFEEGQEIRCKGLVIGKLDEDDFV